ncbi:MAG TPA: hypothetical protein DCL21_00795 [Alphaproteobacteria bacterium]|nr:hypothetical protein [Alphaproteobacteria bacterium]
MEKLNLVNVEVLEVGQQLRVIVESVYGIDNLGLSLKRKYLDPATDKPQWLGETKKLLEMKYNKEVLTAELFDLANTVNTITGDVNNN